jgi:predicted transposase YdaD
MVEQRQRVLHCNQPIQGVINTHYLMDKMANKDIISKQVLKTLAADIANLLLALDIDQEQVELLETEQHRIELRRADLVCRVQKKDSKERFILHIEIQNTNDKQMPLRMLRYFTDIQFAYPEESVCQFLIYIGKKHLTMSNIFLARDFEYRYHILDLRELDCQEMLRRDTPDALVLAILCDFKDKPVNDVIAYIIRRLYELVNGDDNRFRQYMTMLEILSDNRDLQPNIKEVEAMLTDIRMEQLPSYQLAFEKGQSQGIEQGITEGIEQGIEKVAVSLLGLLSHEVIASKTGLPLARIKELAEENTA